MNETQADVHCVVTSKITMALDLCVLCVCKWIKPSIFVKGNWIWKTAAYTINDAVMYRILAPHPSIKKFSFTFRTDTSVYTKCIVFTGMLSFAHCLVLFPFYWCAFSIHSNLHKVLQNLKFHISWHFIFTENHMK